MPIPPTRRSPRPERLDNPGHPSRVKCVKRGPFPQRPPHPPQRFPIRQSGPRSKPRQKLVHSRPEQGSIVDCSGRLHPCPQKVPLRRVTCQRSRPLPFRASFRTPSQPQQQIPANARQQVVVPQHRIRPQPVHQRQSGFRPVREPDRDSPVQPDHGRRQEPFQCLVKCRDPPPVGLLRGSRLGVADRDGRLQHVRPGCFSGTRGTGPQHRRETPVDQQPIPFPPILFVQRDRLSAGADPGGGAGLLNFHQRDESVHFRIIGRGFRQQSPQPQRFQAQAGPHQIVTGGRRVPLVEKQIDDFEHGRQPPTQFGSGRQPVRGSGLGECSLGAGDPARDLRLAGQEGAGDLGGAETGDDAQGERRTCFPIEDRMARDEHQAQYVVAALGDVRGFDVRTVESVCTPQVIHCLAPRDGRQPGARIVRDALGRPPFHGRDQGVLREFLGQADVVDHPQERRDDPRGLLPPDDADRGPDIDHELSRTPGGSGSPRPRRSCGSDGRARSPPPSTAPRPARTRRSPPSPR